MSNITVRDLTCGYRDHEVLSALSLEIKPGQVLALLGPNGCGKTTMLRALSRLLKPSGGCVLVDGDDLWSLRPHAAARRIALTPQLERRDWPLTVEQCVLLGRSPHRGWFLPFTPEDRRVVEQALDGTGMHDLRGREITTLSGGEWRRMILARALAQEANILLLDEPTAGLDLKYQVEVLRLVRRLAAEDELLVAVTLHDLNLASNYADRLALIADGTLAAVGSPEEVLTAETIEQAYGLAVTVVEHPLFGTPLVSPVADP